MKKYLAFVMAIILIACDNDPELQQTELTGYAQGSTFQIKYLDEKGRDLGAKVEALFLEVDASMSTYDTTSLISAINRGDTVRVDAIFMKVLKRSIEIAEETNGLFDPTVGPLVELWGFGLSERSQIDSSLVDSVKRKVGFKRIFIDGNKVALPRGFKLNFNAIAQGYTCDLIADLLEADSIQNYMVEVGGEVRARGVNVDGDIWRLGIEKPNEVMDDEDRIFTVIELKDAGMATSGNYRKFWVDKESGMKYSHTIDPISGYPSMNRLLSATIIASNGMDADAYATVCMAKGVRKTIEFLETKKELEGYFIYTNEDGEWEIYQTKGFEAYLK